MKWHTSKFVHFAHAMGMITILTASISSSAIAQLGLVSEKQELDAGRKADEDIRAKSKISTDKNLNGLVSHLGARLTKVSERPNLDWKFRVIVDKQLNAFSVPGFVYVNTGLIEATKGNQDMLAGVIAHEVGHTTGKHAVKQMEKSAVGGLLAGLIGGKNNTAGALAGVAGNLILLGYSRDDENDADRRAVRYMLKAGYDPNDLVSFFELLAEKEKGGGSGIEKYLRTHPASAERVDRVRKEITKQRNGD
jgi:predicted Zn-dependent protease